jgi:hypothetical protein
VSPGLSPGMIAINSGDYVQTATGMLAIDLGGIGHEEFDRIEIHRGGAVLDGGLEVSLYGGYEPAVGSSFEILWSERTLSGAFDPSLISYPDLPGRRWNLVQRRNTVSLEVLSGILAGDFNGNGIVDAADYTVWRDTLGQTGEGLAADATGPLGTPDGTVDWLDYAFWKSHYGSTLGGDLNSHIAASTEASIPEPSVSWLLGAAMALLSMKRCKQKEA